MTEINIENDEEFDLVDFVAEYVHEKNLLSFKDSAVYNHLMSLKRREKEYTLSDLVRWYEEDEKTIIGRLKRLADCKLIELKMKQDETKE
ncbi:MAG: hypothetical protein ACR2MG_20940 [Pyrinomonadaceae bacterium]